jgi:uncharacterized protein (DUF1330 family)
MSEATKPVYGMVQLNMKDPGEFMERYAQHVFPILDAWGVEMIAGSTTPTTKEGSFSGNWAAVLRFPSMEVAEAWYNSADYEPFKDMRINELTDFSTLVFVEGR